MADPQLSAEEWLAFFEQADSVAMCRTIWAYPHDLTPRYIWLDWLDEHCPDPELPEILRRHVDSSGDQKIESLSRTLGTNVVPWRGRLRLEWVKNNASHERLCQSGAMGCVVFGGSLPLEKFDGWLINGVAIYELTKAGFRSLTTSDRTANLTSLDLWYNAIEVEEAKALANSPHLANLTSLNLGGNRIGAEGATALANSPHLAHLTSLNLWNNEIGADGAKALANSTHLCEAIRSQYEKG